MIRQIITEPYLMLNQNNKIWIDSLIDKNNIFNDSISHPLEFIEILTKLFFPEIIPFNSLNYPQNERNIRLARYLRTIFKDFNLNEPNSWSEILKIKEIDSNDIKNEGVFCFNQAIDGIKNYLSPSSEFYSNLLNEINLQENNCNLLIKDLTIIKKECEFYDKKFENIKNILINENNNEKDLILNLLKDLQI